MSENTTASLKQEILDWANKPGTMDKFTTHDVYEHIHSAETPSHTSDALRSMWKYDKTLDREEFMDGNKKRFVYSLRKNNESNVDIKCTSQIHGVAVESTSEKPHKGLTKGGAIPGLYGVSKSTTEIVSEPIINPAYAAGATAGKGIANTKNNQQIEIPNNFCIELKTPNGFTITIKAGDLMK